MVSGRGHVLNLYLDQEINYVLAEIDILKYFIVTGL